jgi:hypothetical protein
MPVIYPAGLTSNVQVWLGLGVLALNIAIYVTAWRRGRRA